ncbi:hypothetical protein EYF80_045514 [Liparis tanakae]|uniref:Uncharacterized protein n=1 Tax=Liparis tanakae TaxID=230148 RepID=A0A4Z2FSZ2_9TELE|nr:hypothetical protein EYF80_045514 [Liparis tanakae]
MPLSPPLLSDSPRLLCPALCPGSWVSTDQPTPTAPTAPPLQEATDPPLQEATDPGRAAQSSAMPPDAGSARSAQS